MKKIINLLATCVLAICLTNCASTADADSLIEKARKLAKIGKNKDEIKQIEAYFTAAKAQFKEELRALCNEDDIKKMNSILDCVVSAEELMVKAQDDEAKKAAQEASKKCTELPKPQKACFDFLESHNLQ